MLTGSQMISQICEELKNYFPPASKKSTQRYMHHNSYTIVDGNIRGVAFLKQGQYFRIVGSDLNSGVYQFGNEEDMQRLQDETFYGSIWEMSVPPTFLALCEDIQAFNAKCEELSAKDEGFSSESYGGYSYSINGTAPAYMQAWQNRIRQGLNTYRRLSVL